MKQSFPAKHRAPRGETFQEVLSRRLARRSFLRGALAAVPLLLAGPSVLLRNRGEAASEGLTFQPISLDNQDRVLVPEGYQSEVLLRWGDPLLPGAPSFDVLDQTAAKQRMQFGTNCDYVGYYPLPQFRSNNPDRGLLVVNHEFTTPELMFFGYVAGSPTQDQVDVEIAAHGVSVVEIRRHGRAGWTYIEGSRFNRRITGETEIQITGPAAGDDLLKVSYDPDGTTVRGAFNTCAGGKTLWGTTLTCEENFNQYFANRNALPDSDARKAIHTRYGLPTGSSERRWENFHDRFNIAIEPNEPFRFGWCVEIDPYNLTSFRRNAQPSGAISRHKKEGATMALAKDGRVVVYTGDDERFDYMYKFVSNGKLRSRREDNSSLLDDGGLYVAKLNDDGTGTWIPMTAGTGPLTGWSEAMVLINTRGAADLLGATQMDRPEDIETNPVNGKLYCVFTNNTNRGVGSNPPADAANPRTRNNHGHIVELTEEGNDPAATSFTWEIFILCGDPSRATPAPSPHPVLDSEVTYFAGFDPSLVSPISSPDNIVFDKKGNLWIATDGQPNFNTLSRNDGFYAVPVEGPDRGFCRQFLSVPTGAETCGPEFTPDNQTLFIAVQHAAESSGSTISSPSSTWPDGDVPKPSVIVVTKNRKGSKVIGT